MGWNCPPYWWSEGVGLMTFHSILFESTTNSVTKEPLDAPDFFMDLNLDQIVDAIIAPKQEYNLRPFFYAPLHDVEVIRYRHEVMQDMEDGTLLEYIKTFAQNMLILRRYLVLIEKLDFNYHKKGWFLEAALDYCDAVTNLGNNLGLANLKSCGLLAFREYVTHYVQSPGFHRLVENAQTAKAGLSGVKYSVIAQLGKFSVRKYAGETDYTEEVESLREVQTRYGTRLSG